MAVPARAYAPAGHVAAAAATATTAPAGTRWPATSPSPRAAATTSLRRWSTRPVRPSDARKPANDPSSSPTTTRPTATATTLTATAPRSAAPRRGPVAASAGPRAQRSSGGARPPERRRRASRPGAPAGPRATPSCRDTGWRIRARWKTHAPTVDHTHGAMSQCANTAAPRSDWARKNVTSCSLVRWWSSPVEMTRVRAPSSTAVPGVNASPCTNRQSSRSTTASLAASSTRASLRSTPTSSTPGPRACSWASERTRKPRPQPTSTTRTGPGACSRSRCTSGRSRAATRRPNCSSSASRCSSQCTRTASTSTCSGSSTSSDAGIRATIRAARR